MKTKSRAKAKKPTPKKKPAAKAPKGRALRRDTPLDTPALVVSGGFDPAAAVADALAAVRRIETLSAAYQAWAELRREHAAALAKLNDERKQLEQQGEFLVGAVRAARDLASAPSVGEALALAREGGLDSFVEQSARKLEQARSALEARSRAVAEAFGGAFAQVRDELKARIAQRLQHVRPKLKLLVRNVGADRRILHVARVSDEEAVLLAWVLLQKLPSRYDFLFDDSTDDATRAPPTLFAEEGISAGQVRPDARALLALVEQSAEVLPLKSAVPFLVPRHPGPPQLTRLVERGPVMEAEVADGEQFRNFLTREEAERLAGYFLRLKLQGRVELELGEG